MGDTRDILPHSAGYFKSKNIFEKSRNPAYPLSVWYSGMLSACTNKSKVISELNRRK